MMRLKKIALLGEGINAKSPVITRQRRLNVYLEVRKDGDKSSIMAYGTPGMAFAFNASTPLNYPARGLIGNETSLYLVAGNQVKSMTATGGTVVSGILGTSAGLVGMSLNPTQVLIVDGSQGYIFNPTTGAVTVIAASFPNGALTCTQCNGFFLAELPGTNEVFVSALNDGTTWNGLSFFTAVQAIDGVKAVDQINGLVVVFSSGHLEFWQNAGLTIEPFQYIQNSASMYGLAAVNGRAHAGDSLLFLARTNGGAFQNSAGAVTVCKIKGYSVENCSTSDIDNILQTMDRTATITDCSTYSYQIDEHPLVQFNFPTANRSLLYDLKTDLWSEVQSGITPNYAARHIGNLSANAFRKTFIADYSIGNLYTPDPTVHTDNGNTIVRQIVSRVALEDFNSFGIGAVYLDMATGVGLASPSAQGYAPQVGLSLARDNRDFGYERLIALGARGQYNQRVLARRWGRARQANLSIRLTDPVPFIVTSAAMLVKSQSSISTGGGRGRSR